MALFLSCNPHRMRTAVDDACHQHSTLLFRIANGYLSSRHPSCNPHRMRTAVDDACRISNSELQVAKLGQCLKRPPLDHRKEL
ncbi:hypothetical protein ElyMa_001090500 [Elysia marginata]|uniref:Uncharacterized protein n=1 Tax=Elysia marginata TaxID=1093978 RepID=A0AAV4HWY8_9GAST|nr:hypothetical protein ElyMa_001090500 [Elysia marginata]